MVSEIIKLALPSWLEFKYVAAGLGLLAVSFGMVVWRFLRLRGQRRRHVASHSALGDEEFIKALGIEAVVGDGACRVRGVVARVMGVPAGTVYPSDELGYVAGFGFDGMDFKELAFRIERVLDVEIPERGWKRFFKSGSHEDVADLIRFLAEEHYLSPIQSASPPA